MKDPKYKNSVGYVQCSYKFDKVPTVLYFINILINILILRNPLQSTCQKLVISLYSSVEDELEEVEVVEVEVVEGNCR